MFESFIVEADYLSVFAHDNVYRLPDWKKSWLEYVFSFNVLDIFVELAKGIYGYSVVWMSFCDFTKILYEICYAFRDDWI